MLKSKWINILANLTAIFLGLVFFTSGMAKLFFDHRFPCVIGPVWFADVLAAYDLRLFGEFVAVAQILIGYILITLRFRTIGALMVFPMLMNIFMITFSQDWRGTPYVIAFFLLQNLFLIFVDYSKLAHLITDELPNFTNIKNKKSLWGSLIWVLGCFLNFYSINISYNIGLNTAYIACCVAIALGFMSFWADKYSNKQVA